MNDLGGVNSAGLCRNQQLDRYFKSNDMSEGGADQFKGSGIITGNLTRKVGNWAMEVKFW